MRRSNRQGDDSKVKTWTPPGERRTYSQKEIAAAAGVTHQTIQQIEASALDKIRQHLDYDPELRAYFLRVLSGE